MTTTQEHDLYLAQFARIEKGDDVWLLATRQAGIARFAALGFPTTRDEEWKYTNVARIARTRFGPASAGAAGVTVAQIQAATFDDSACSRLVFVNGLYTPELSSLSALPTGVHAGSLAEAWASDRKLVERHLARHARFDENAFTALNTALFEDGAFVHLPREAVVEQPIHLVFVSTNSAEPTVTHPRTLVVAETSSQATIVESYVGPDGGTYFTNAVTELVAEDNAVLDYYKLEAESPQAYHIGAFHIHQGRDTNVTSHTISLDGGALVRHGITARLDAPGCVCTLNGLYVVAGKQHVDNHLLVEHAKPHGDSREFFKGVLADHATGAFTGRIIVYQDAQKTDAKQTNRNLLLSPDAHVDTRPQLEIFANDVKCTHGATIGQLDTDAIFYLRTRGIPEEAARNLLVYAFARETLDEIRIAPLAARLQARLAARLPHGDSLTEDS